MRLSELDPTFIRYETRQNEMAASGSSEYLIKVSALAEAQGIKFLCPTCFVRNGGEIGTHLIQVSFAGRGVQDHQGSRNREGKPSRWSASGSSLADLTTTPSILIDPCPPACDGWHGFITAGEIK